MARNHRTTIRSTVLAAAGILAFSIEIAAANPVGKEHPQGLWVGGSQYISEFQGKALKKSGDPKANLAFGSSEYFTPRSMTFDRKNNLWITFGVINYNLPAPVLEITHGDLASLKRGKKMKPKVLITERGSTGIPFTASGPSELAFDEAGDLWVTDQGAQAIMDFTPSQIKESGSPTPTISITSPDFVPEVIRFDGSGNLWVAEFRLTYEPSNPLQLWRFSPGDRAVSGQANPSLTMNLPDGLYPADLAFDSSGNLWLAGSSSHGDALEMISASNLTGTGEISPSATVTITASAFGFVDGSGSCLGGFDFDQSGDLWVSVGADNADCQADTQLVEFTPAQLNTGGNLTPSVIIGQNSTETNLFFPGPIRFGPSLK